MFGLELKSLRHVNNGNVNLSIGFQVLKVLFQPIPHSYPQHL